MYELRGMTCNRIIVLAAGRATRMRTSAASVEQTRFAQDALERPKPMIRVGPNGEPMLELILEQALRAGFTEATVVIAPNDTITPAFLQEWEGRGLGMRVQTALQPEPKGTGHAVQCALESDPLPSGALWVLANGDNLPTRSALSRLRTEGAGPAVLAYDRDALGLDPAKTMAFAVLEGDGSTVHRITEKPAASVVERLAASGSVRVSMNYFRLDGERLQTHLSALAPHPARGELELPTALQAMMDAGTGLTQINAAEEVLDLTRIQDVAGVQAGMHLLEPFQLEVCASSPSDVRTAAAAGAQRVELCAHWECGGLTPTEVDIRLARVHGLPVHALIRCRAGHFVYSEEEKALMTAQIEGSLAAGATRVVVGALQADGTWDAPLLERWVGDFGAHRIVIHRAFDACTDWEGAAAALEALGVRRLLTSGGELRAWDGRDRIRQLVDGGFDVTVGSGVVPEQREDWMALGVTQFHASCREVDEHPTALFDGKSSKVSAAAVRRWFNP